MNDEFKVIAVDFDGTLCENKWPDIGEPNEDLIKHLISRQAEGIKIILWTCRVGERLNEAVNWCYERGLIFDEVNNNTPEVIDLFGTESRKIFANEYIDDRMSDEFKLPFIARHSHYGKMGGRE